MHRCLRFSFILIALLVMSAPANAWGPEAHRIIAAIAEEHLTPATKAAVKDLIRNRSLADIANWADDVREQPDYEWTKPLHYINVPRDALAVNIERDCPEDGCIIAAIKHSETLLRGTGFTNQQRTNALMFLVHFIGDIHQPMHVAYRDDFGGNRLEVFFMSGERTNLHRVWDSHLLRHRMGDVHWSRFADELKQSINQEQVQRWGATLAPVAWANESLAVTRRIYATLPSEPNIEQQYYDENIGTVIERMSMAGIRTAAMLNDIFDGGEPAAPPDEPPVKDDEPAKPVEPPAELQHIEIIFEGECGEGGRMAFLRNTHATRTIEVTVKQSWTIREGRQQSRDLTIVLRPGERDQRRLGCTHQRISAREVREFEWEVVTARFR